MNKSIHDLVFSLEINSLIKLLMNLMNSFFLFSSKQK